MVDKKIVMLLLSIVLLTGCGVKKADNNAYLKDFTNTTYVEGKSDTTTTTTTTTMPVEETTTKVPTTKKSTVKVNNEAKPVAIDNNVNQYPIYTGSTTIELKAQADAYIVKYKDKINEMIDLINKERAKEGIAPVEYSYELTVVATVRSLEMKETGVFEHARQCPGNVFNDDTNPDLEKNKDKPEDQVCKKWHTAFNDLDVIYKRAAENIARGFYTVESAMNGFMNSPSHRKNIMNQNLKYVGIGVAEDGEAYYFSQEFKA